jgi:hypothetical protein
VCGGREEGEQGEGDCGIGKHMRGWVGQLKKQKKKLNCSLLNYSHVSREPNFGKILGISSISLTIQRQMKSSFVRLT